VSIDPRAASGFGSGSDAYERVRPSYPERAVERLARYLGVGPDSSVVDLGAGTGKLARLLARHAGRVIAVEPSTSMREALARLLPVVELHAGSAESIPLPSGSVDAVFAAQAFHWFEVTAAAREIARVLRPGGGLGLVWNRYPPRARRQARVEDVWPLLEPFRVAAGPFPAQPDWERQFAARFEPLRRFTERHVHALTPEQLITLVGSFSWIANLSERQRGEVLERVGELVGGYRRIELSYATDVIWTRMTP
jgi:SAM-dependent methyltransferase